MNKISVSKDKIIIIALIYKYITKREKTISKNDALSFCYEVNKNLGMMSDCCYTICFDDELPLLLHLMYNDKEKEEYILNEHAVLDMWYDNNPKEIIHATLMENALSVINIKRSDLKINKKYKKNYGTMGIYSLSEKSAKESTKKILEQEGNKNIKIGSATSTTFDGGVGYNVSYECDKLLESANILIKK